jgi:hypothetical protein
MEPVDFRTLNKPKCSNCAKLEGCKYVEPTGTACLSHVHKAMRRCTCGNAEVRLSMEVTALAPDGVFVASCPKCGKREETGVSFADCIAKWNSANELGRA